MQPQRDDLGQEVFPGDPCLYLHLEVADALDCVERRTIDDKAALHLRLPGGTVTLPAHCDGDCMLSAETDCQGDVFYDGGLEHRDRSVVNNVAKVVCERGKRHGVGQKVA